MEAWRIKSRVLALGLALAVGTAGVWPPSTAAADVNGDRTVDVRDVHAMLSVLFTAPGGPARADVNGDGAVDILDFQALLDVTQHEKPAKKPSFGNAMPLAALQPAPNAPVPGHELRMAALPRMGAVEMLRPACLAPVLDFGAVFRTQRYGFQLFPHGPPA